MPDKVFRLIIDVDSRKAKKGADEAERGMTRLQKQVGMAGKAFVALGAAMAGVAFAKLARSSIAASIQFERIDNALKAVTGSSALAAREFAFVSGESDRLGLSLKLAAKDYAQLAAAAKGTALEGQAAREIFSAVGEAATVMGLSADQTSGALLAIQQIISKGTVSAEELRQQLGERLPGAFQLAARAMGVSTAELGKMLQRGEVMAEDMLPRLAAELRSTFGAGLPDAVNSTQAAFNRFETAMLQLQRAMGDALAPAVVELADQLRNIANDASIREMFVQLGGALAKGVELLSGAVKALAENWGLVTAALKAYVAIKIVQKLLDTGDAAIYLSGTLKAVAAGYGKLVVANAAASATNALAAASAAILTPFNLLVVSLGAIALAINRTTTALNKQHAEMLAGIPAVNRYGQAINELRKTIIDIGKGGELNVEAYKAAGEEFVNLTERLQQAKDKLAELQESAPTGPLQRFDQAGNAFITQAGRAQRAIEEQTAAVAALKRQWDGVNRLLHMGGNAFASNANAAGELNDELKKKQDRLKAIPALLEAHRRKLAQIEQQYRKEVDAIRDWIKGIQDLEQNFEDFESTVDIGGSLDNIGLEQLQANVAAAISGGILDGIPEDPPTKWDELSKALGETLSETLASALSTAIGNALSSGDIEGAIAGLGASLGQAAGLALGQGNPIAGAIGSALGGVLGDAIGGALFGDDGSEEAARKAEEAFKQLHDTIRSSMPGIRQEVIETFEAILDILRLMGEAGQATGEEMAAIGRELQNTVDSITGISTGDFADRISAAQEFNQTLLTMPENIQAAFDQIDLSALAESIAAEFMGITSHLDLSAAQRDAQHLREAISGLGLESGKTADLLRQVTQAERLRIAEIRAGALAQLADLMERAGIRSAEAAQLRAKYEQIQFQVALKRLEVELQLLNLWTKATQQIIGELTEFAGNLGNFVGGITGGLSAPLEVPRVGGRRGGGGRRQKRRDLLDELERLMNTGGGNTFADRLRDLNKQFAELRKRARKLKVPLEKVNAAYEAQLKALRDQALGGLRDFRDNLLTGPLSPLSMQQRFFAARTRFNDLARRAAGGDLDATAQLGAASQEYLDLARQMFGTTQQFDRIFDEVLGLVNGVLGIGGLKDEEATRHDQVLSQLQNTDELQLEMHGSANDWREKNWKKNRDNGRVLEEIRDVLGRLENVA